MAGRLKFVVASVLAGASLAGGAADDNPLADERWRARPLVIVVPAADDPLLAQVQTALLSETTRAAFEEREMVLYKVVAGAGSRAERLLSASQTQALLGALGVAAKGPGHRFPCREGRWSEDQRARQHLARRCFCRDRPNADAPALKGRAARQLLGASRTWFVEFATLAAAQSYRIRHQGASAAHAGSSEDRSFEGPVGGQLCNRALPNRHPGLRLCKQAMH
jgi:hypothetical protein